MSEAEDELYRNEGYKFGSKERELTEFLAHVQRVFEAQRRLVEQHSSTQPRRVFHAKTHACLTGKLNLLESRPESTRHGLLGSTGKTSYNVLARFSNGVGFVEHDLKPDVRGLALKIFGVNDRLASTNEPQTIDFLMTNSTNAFGLDQEEFVQFMEASVNPGMANFNLLRYLAEHREVARLLLKASLRIVPSVAAEQYWSGHPSLLGPDQAMKFNVRPSSDTVVELEDEDLREEMVALESKLDSIGDRIEGRIEHWLHMFIGDFGSKVNPNYLSIDLLKRARRGSIKFTFSVQLEKDTESTPIENGLIEWKESDSPSIPVAELVLDQQDKSQDCEDLRFTPGHRMSDHRPLGNIGRGRIFTYEASQDGRRADSKEPNESMFFGK